MKRLRKIYAASLCGFSLVLLVAMSTSVAQASLKRRPKDPLEHHLRIVYQEPGGKKESCKVSLQEMENMAAQRGQLWICRKKSGTELTLEDLHQLTSTQKVAACFTSESDILQLTETLQAWAELLEQAKGTKGTVSFGTIQDRRNSWRVFLNSMELPYNSILRIEKGCPKTRELHHQI